jgi:hypothetical protein
MYLINKLPKFLLLIGLIINIILTSLFYNITSIDPIILLGMVSAAIFLEHIYGEYLKNIYTKLIVTALLVLGYIRLMSFWEIKSLQQYFDFIREVNIKVYYSQEMPLYDILPVAILILTLVTFLLFAAERKLKGNWSIAAQFIYLSYISYYPEDYKSFYIAVVLLSILYFSINIYRRSKIQAKGEAVKFSVEAKKLTINYAVVITVIFTIALGLVKTTGTKSLSEIRELLRKNILKNVQINMTKMYELSNYGFGDGEKLGGPLILNSEIMFRVDSDKAYYLRGIVKDYYTGEKWNNTSSNYQLADKPDGKLLNRKLQEKLLGDSLVAGFNEPKQITVYNEEIKSTSLFTPYNTVMVTAGKKYIGTTKDNSYMLLDKNTDYSYYNVSFYKSTTGLDNFEEFYNRNQKLDYSPYFDNPTGSIEVENTKSFYWRYLQLPYNITDRTKELQKSIVSGNISIEGKIYRIMDFLRKNYSYELNVPKVPDNTEFTDYFLFEQKNGYCTSFATAAVILCRLEGIPARYVEGFSMDNTKDTDGLHVVRASNAHAWCEVLVSAENNLWAVLESTPADYRPEGNITVQSSDAIKKLINKNDDKINLSKIIESEKAAAGKFTAISFSFLVPILKVVLIFISLLCLLLTLRLIYKMMKRKKYVNKILRYNKINLLYYYIKERLAAIGVANSPNLSDQEYLSSIQDEKLKAYLEEIVSIYQEEYYGDKAYLSLYDKKKYFKQIEEYIRRKQNILSYIINKYELHLRLNFKNNNEVK